MDMILDELGYWLALYTIPRCSFSVVSVLLKKFTNPKKILLASYEELLNAGISSTLANNLKNPDWKNVELCLHWAEQPQRYILHWGNLYYPSLLNEISVPPLILFVAGDLSILQQQNLAIVGARNPTPTGLEIAYQLANQLSEQKFSIISGLAKGIDGAAHQGALLKGTTVAVLGSGLEHIYPACHQTLAMEILEKGGTLISEFFPYASPKAEFFPRRNRIISGMSLGVIVVEATLRSGSLITARYALEQGREVFAVPGSIRNPLSEGCHALLKEGATLIETYEDVINGLSFLPKPRVYESVDPIGKKALKSTVKSSQSNNLDLVLNHKISHTNSYQLKKDLTGLDSQDIKLVECLGFETTTIDSLVARTGLAIDKLLARLSVLQLKGYIDVVPGGYVRK
jgi:DNA processing protein